MECKLYLRDPPEADSAIIFDWAKCFLEETKELRRNNQHLLLVLDGYSAHLQFNTLNLFRSNNIIVVALPAHISHELKPLYVTVFGAFKSYLQQELHKGSKHKKVFNAFDIWSIMYNAYSLSFVAPTITSGFIRSGLWDPQTGNTNINSLKHLFFKPNEEKGISLKRLLDSFMRRNKSLLRDADIEDQGRIRINTAAGHITSETVLSALRARDTQRRNMNNRKRLFSNVEEGLDSFRESAKDLRRLGELAERRAEQRKHLRLTRDQRRHRQGMMISQLRNLSSEH